MSGCFFCNSNGRYNIVQKENDGVVSPDSFDSRFARMQQATE